MLSFDICEVAMGGAGKCQAVHRVQAGAGPCSFQAGSPGGVHFSVEQNECGDQANVTMRARNLH